MFPGSHCDEYKTQPHLWNGIRLCCHGLLMVCKYCHKHLWLPVNATDVYELSALMKRMGVDNGYCEFLNRYKDARMLMVKVQMAEKLSDTGDTVEYARNIARIMSIRNIDRKEDSNGSN